MVANENATDKIKAAKTETGLAWWREPRSERFVQATKNWLQFTRAPTFPTMLIPVMVGFMAAGGALFSFRGAGWLLFAFFAHAAAFGHNSLTDVKYDVEKGRVGRPLVSGEISIMAAKMAVALFATAALAIGVTLLATGSAHVVAWVVLFIFVAAGYAYNRVSKVFSGAWALLSVSFTSLMLFAYLAESPALAPPVVLLAVYIFLTFWFETDWEGNLKDIEFGGANTLRDRFGAKVGSDGWLTIGGRARLYGWAIKVAALVTALSVTRYYDYQGPAGILAALAAGVFAATAACVCVRLMCDGRWDRRKALLLIGAEEVSSLCLPLAVIAPAAGILEAAVLVAFGVAWTVASTAVYKTKGFLGKQTNKQKEERERDES